MAVFFWETLAGVGHFDHERIAVPFVKLNPDLALSPLGLGNGADRLSGVLDDVCDSLRDEATVEVAFSRAAWDFVDEGDVRMCNTHHEDHLTHRLSHIVLPDPWL